MSAGKDCKIFVGGQIVNMPKHIADKFKKGDKLINLPESQEIFYLSKAQVDIANEVIDKSEKAFQQMSKVTDRQMVTFFKFFADNLQNDKIWGKILEANQEDLKKARTDHKPVARLELNDKVRRKMIAGLHYWAKEKSHRNQVLHTIQRNGFVIEEMLSPYGIIAFVFESRPDVFVDACGVLKFGNTCILRIGSDAMQTVKNLMQLALKPALKKSRLPENAVLVLEKEYEIIYALFSNKKLGLAVVRGSGRSVEILGGIARGSGVPVSLHGQGGAWMIIDEEVDLKKVELLIYNSLDRKVCNTLNTICVLKKNAKTIIKVILKVLEKRGQGLGHGYRLHVSKSAKVFLPHLIQADLIDEDKLGQEWEWDKVPEITIHAVDDLDSAIEFFNRQSSRFVASLISVNKKHQAQFINTIEAPFVGNGFTRWVDGQYVYHRPELGLSNWQEGRILGRSGILSGANLFTVKLIMRQSEKELER